MTATTETTYSIQPAAPLPDLWPSHMQNILTISQDSQESYPISSKSRTLFQSGPGIPSR